MTPRPLDPDSVQRKLVGLEDLLARLEPRRGVTVDDLSSDDMLRDSTLWIMLQLVTLAASAANHLAAATLGRSGATYSETFELAVEAGIVDADLLPSLRGASAMRNILAHQYDDVDLALVATAIPAALTTFGTFAQQVAAWLVDRT